MNDPYGSRWRKWDLHFHTPKSYDYGNKGMSAKNIVDRLLEADVEVVAITDHHVMDVDLITEVQTIAGDDLSVLPGIEFSCPLGGHDGVHFIGIFPENSDINYVSNQLLSDTGINKQRAEGKNDQQIYVDFKETAEAIKRLGGLISIHAHAHKSNSIENIANNSALKLEFKKDITASYIDLFEVSKKDQSTDYIDHVFPNIGFSRPVIIASDDHCKDSYPRERCCWIKADATFSGLKMAIREPQNRFCLDPIPFDLNQLESNKTKYIKSIAFAKSEAMPQGEEWLQGDVPLNPGLVAIIGNKGSGKSALADCIGLLGSCSTSDAFSFLEKKRFRDPKTGRAHHVTATMSWYGGTPTTCNLNEDVQPDEPERVKYLPQNFVEDVCNDLESPDGGKFEKELKKVVFSKIVEADRLEKRSLDDLVDFRTEELRDEAEGKAEELDDLSEEREKLEAQSDPAVKTGLEKRIAQKKEEIQSHEGTKPEEKPKPTDIPGGDPNLADFIKKLDELQANREKVKLEIAKHTGNIKDQQLRASTAEKLLAKFDNLIASVGRSIDDMSIEATALGLEINDLVKLSITDELVKGIRDEAIARRDESRATLGSTEVNPATGLLANLDTIDTQIKAIQDQLSRPHQEYQLYLEAIKKWQLTLDQHIGSNDDPDSLAGLEAALEALEELPGQIETIEEEQEDIAKSIHELRVKEASVYTELYAPVQKFITDHHLANEHLRLEFKVELVESGFVDQFLSFINHNRAGSFYGVEDGTKVAKDLISRVTWSNWESVKDFLDTAVKHLHHDMRSGKDEREVLLESQLAQGKSGKSAADLYRWLYGLTYLKPRYLLRWEGKDVAQLSPGERGTLLLIFYLLVDDSDLPLIIDQPEANLDNDTVAKKLVHCIRDARSRRQVIIVTHNPNLAVVCDADQVIYASMDKPNGNKISYQTGALENPEMNQFTIDVLEGGRAPFDMRDDTYVVTGS